MHIMNQPSIGDKEDPICLVLAPTRELVSQIHEVTKDLGSRMVCFFLQIKYLAQ